VTDTIVVGGRAPYIQIVPVGSGLADGGDGPGTFHVTVDNSFTAYVNGQEVRWPGPAGISPAREVAINRAPRSVLRKAS